MSDELSNATRIAALTADVIRLTSELQSERDDLAAVYKAKCKLIDACDALQNAFDERNAYAERLLAENVRLSNEAAEVRETLDSLRQSIYAACAGSGCVNAHELRVALDRERERCGVLEMEVRAWRDWQMHCEVWPLSNCTCEDKPRGPLLATAMAETDTRHALDAAKFVGGGQ